MTFINISDNIIPSEIKVTSIYPYVYTNMFNTTQKKNKTRKRNNKQSLK